MKNPIMLVGIIILILIGIVGVTSFQNNESEKILEDSKKINEKQVNADTKKPNDMKKLNKPELTIDSTKAYTATLTTSEGVIEIELFADKVPITVNNFVYLAQEKFYDSTIFHRAIQGFMIQGGDPSGNGTGGPGYQFDDEEFEGSYDRGIVAMANAGPNTNGSQFFIMHAKTDLPPNYVIFGKVTKGIDVVDSIATAEVMGSPSGEKSSPISPVKILKVFIQEK